jgi:lipid II:glycine glycyltransferase (peptidoglycan interpeptide bridge formation enzyme)
MLHLKRKKLLLQFNEYYFFDQELDQITHPGILNVFVQSKSPIDGFRNRSTQTLLIDLRQEEEEIFAKIKKGYRYDIRQSDKDDVDLTLKSSPSASDIDDFCAFYNAFAYGLGIAGANKRKLTSLMEMGALVFTEVKNCSDTILVRHALIFDDKRVRLLYSGSLYREMGKEMKSLIGRSNKALHWYELMQFKSLGKKYYDFGGISIDGSTKNIDKFKFSFGGSKVGEYYGMKICI